MVNWNSPIQIAHNAASFSQLMHVLLGLYAWEWFVSLPFDWDYISRKRAFRWPLIFYWLNRYCLLFSMIGIAIALDTKSPIDCQTLYTFNSVVGNATVGLASINLSLRTIAIWSQNAYLVVPLVVLMVGQWALLLHGILVHAQWDPISSSCVITQTDSKLLAASFIYTMAFDLIVLLLTTWKLVLGAPRLNGLGSSRLSDLIFKDGLIYFAIAFLANLLASVFMLMNLNPVMSIIANVPAATASTIVACRIVRRLSEYTHGGPERFGPTTHASTLAFRTTSSMTAPPGLKRGGILSPSTTQKGFEADGGVRVEMEVLESPGTEYDVMGRPIVGHRQNQYDNDPEAQKIHNEFRHEY